MNGDLGQALPLLFLAGAALVLLFPWALTRLSRSFRPHREKRDESTLLLSTVQEVVTGIRESESDLRDMYSKAERKASFLERYHRSILESMKTGVVACNRRGEITALNGAAASILGISENRARGRRLDRLVGPGHLFPRLLEDVIHGRPVEDRLELKIQRRGEEPRWIELRTSILHGRSGQPVGTTFLLDDVTERNLLRRRMALKERLAAMGEISAGIAHEFRNALHALQGLAKLIGRRAEGNERIEPLAAEILGETARMERILHELRVFQNPQPLALEDVDAEALIRSVLLPFVEQQGPRPVRFEVRTDDDLPRFRGDRTALAQALRNLVGNAMSAMSGEGGTLTISVSAPGGGAGPARRVRIAVSDTGPGIPEEARDKIFTPFYTTKEDGTGLGLPLVQKVVAAHGGSVDFDSTRAAGATFTLDLPAAGAPEAPMVASSSPASPGRREEGMGGGL
ncbi:MAG: ATP-binding protein [Candidatus Eisenbacteria bacterium]